jgi:hypothetical protein
LISKIEQRKPSQVIEVRRLKQNPSVLNYFLKNREIYRQLKYALSKQGDIVNEQKFHTQEMLVYDRSLLFRKDFWTKLIIKLSYCFSDFGQSFLKPLLWLLIGHWLLFMVLIQSNNYNDLLISFSNPTWAGFELGIERYFQLINPLRKTETGFSGSRIILDLAMRVWASYMIYNLVRATRRFIK